MNSDINVKDLLACAVAAARAAGGHALQNAVRRSEVITTSSHDVKLQLDIECQQRAESVIRAKFPAHSILGEESSGTDERQPDVATGLRSNSFVRQAAGEVGWIIDPIDGTVNFSHGLPLWCCSIAVRHGEDIVAGAVYAPELNELYTASVDEPALHNGSPINVSAIDSLSRSIVLTGLDKNVDPNLPPFAIFKQIASNTQKARIMGSAALDICQVACGRADGYFESGIYIWDVAAAGLIVKQAGGEAEILGYQDNNRLQFLATNSRIHADLKRLIETSGCGSQVRA